MKKIIIFIIIILLLSTTAISNINARESILDRFKKIDNEAAYNCYAIYQPEYSRKTFLINKEGKTVHTWKSRYAQSLPAYLLENGSIIRSCYGNIHSLGWGGGFTGRVEMLDWDSNLLWEFTYVNKEHCLHNDIEPLPNGNVLMIVWEKKTRQEAIDHGCNPALIPLGGFQIDKIIEVEPIYPKGANIVWEWEVWDHTIQDYDETKENYGIPADHPELVDINYRGNKRIGHYSNLDFSHINSVDYHEEFDQILLSMRTQNEIWIIDHSTTIEESANHSGGRYKKGGDILYRWGNPQVYGAGDESDQFLYDQHDPRWVEEGCPGEGHITIFNNGVERTGLDYSSVEEIIPPVNETGFYYLEEDEAYGPEEPCWVYDKSDHFFYSPYISSAERLPNGNTLINNGISGTFFEVTPEKEIVWRYINKIPIMIPALNSVFKVQCYSNDYPGLARLKSD